MLSFERFVRPILDRSQKENPVEGTDHEPGCLVPGERKPYLMTRSQSGTEGLQSPEVDNHNSMIVILTGPTSCGKNTIADELISKNPQKRQRLISRTTRDVRPGEKRGREYTYTTPDKFQHMVEANELIAVNEYANGSYGTEIKRLKKAVESGTDVYWILDAETAATIEEEYDKKFDPAMAHILKDRTVVVYVGVDSLETAKSRFLKREADSGDPQKTREKFLKRIHNDWAVWKKFWDRFLPNLVINSTGHLQETVAMVNEVIEMKRHQLDSDSKSSAA